MSSATKYPHGRILLFCKAPVVGQVKTRLIPELGAEGACELHSRLLEHILATLIEAQLCPVELWVAGNLHDDFFKQIHDLDEGDGCAVTLHEQQGTDLGERMFYAARTALEDIPHAADGFFPDRNDHPATTADYALLIGSDCPAIDVEYLDDALAMLEQGSQAVLGPALDGGYVLLGLRKAEQVLFEEINWGSDSVCDATCRKLNQLKWQWSLAKTLWDIDTPEDLGRLDRIVLKVPAASSC